MASSISAGTTSSTALVATADTSGALVLQTNNGTTALTISTSQVTTLANALPVASGGTGLTSTPSNGALDIGNGTGFTRTTLTAGSGITVTNAAGAITIASSGGSGSAVAWAMFNGAGSVTSIKYFNVSSVTFNSTGNYTVNFTTAIADANYAVVGSAGNSDGANRALVLTTTRSTSACAIKTYNGGNSNDNASIIGVAFFD